MDHRANTEEAGLFIAAVNIGAFTPDNTPGGTFILHEEHELVRRRDDNGKWVYSPGTRSPSKLQRSLCKLANMGYAVTAAGSQVDPSWFTVEHMPNLDFITCLKPKGKGSAKYERLSDASDDDESELDVEEMAKVLDYKGRRRSGLVGEPQGKSCSGLAEPVNNGNTPQAKRNVTWENGTLEGEGVGGCAAKGRIRLVIASTGARATTALQLNVTPPVTAGDDDKLIELYLSQEGRTKNRTGLGLRKVTQTKLTHAMAAYFRESKRKRDAENLHANRIRYVTHRTPVTVSLA